MPVLDGQDSTRAPLPAGHLVSSSAKTALGENVFHWKRGKMPARPWLHPEGAGRSLPPSWLLHAQSVFIITPGLRALTVPLSLLAFFSAL